MIVSRPARLAHIGLFDGRGFRAKEVSDGRIDIRGARAKEKLTRGPPTRNA
jgi:hypothetical protein